MLKKTARLLRGTQRYRITALFPERVVNLCAARGIGFWDTVFGSDGSVTLTVQRSDRVRLCRAMEGIGAAVVCEGEEGLPTLVRRLVRRRVLLLGLCLCAALLLLNSCFIWDFRVSGNGAVPAEKILRVLEREGLHCGSSVWSVEPQELCNHALSELPELCWLTVNVRGCRAEVLVMERVPKPETAQDGQPSNVIARRDAVVTEVRALAGKAAVLPGSTVRKGDLLISGAVRTEGAERPSIPLRLLAGQGSVYGRTWYTLSVKVALFRTEKRYEGKPQHAVCLRWGKNCLEICGKDSRNLWRSCDRIRKCIRLSLPNAAPLPLALTWETRQSCTAVRVPRSEAEARTLGTALLRGYLDTQTDGTVRQFTVTSVRQGDYLLVSAEAECLEQIGQRVPLTQERTAENG